MQLLYLLLLVFILVKLPAGTKENWFKMNVGQTGFYRVNYQTDNWQKLVRQLSTSHKVTVIVLLSALLSGVCCFFHGCSEGFSLCSLSKFFRIQSRCSYIW